MEPIKYVSLMLILFLLIIGCSGTNGKLKTQSESDSKVTQKELIDNWSDYTVYTRWDIHIRDIVVFDPKNDDREILLDGGWDRIQDQETFAGLTSDGEFSLEPDGLNRTAIRVQEIWGSDNQLYGFVIYTDSKWVWVQLVDENTLRLETRSH